MGAESFPPSQQKSRRKKSGVLHRVVTPLCSGSEPKEDHRYRYHRSKYSTWEAQLNGRKCLSLIDNNWWLLGMVGEIQGTSESENKDWRDIWRHGPWNVTGMDCGGMSMIVSGDSGCCGREFCEQFIETCTLAVLAVLKVLCHHCTLSHTIFQDNVGQHARAFVIYPHCYLSRLTKSFKETINIYSSDWVILRDFSPLGHTRAGLCQVGMFLCPCSSYGHLSRTLDM